MSWETYNGCVIDVDNFGILIEGPSGSGKTSLMLGLHERLSEIGVSSRLVSDDYASVRQGKGGIEASAPQSIEGKAEIRGYGIVPISYSTRPVSIGLIVRLAEDHEVPRMREYTTSSILSHDIELLKVPTRHEKGAVRIILAWLRDNTDITLPILGS